MTQLIKVVNFHNYRPESYYIRSLADAAYIIERLRESKVYYQVRYVSNDAYYEGWWLMFTDEEALGFFLLMVDVVKATYKRF